MNDLNPVLKTQRNKSLTPYKKGPLLKTICHRAFVYEYVLVWYSVCVCMTLYVAASVCVLIFLIRHKKRVQQSIR